MGKRTFIGMIEAGEPLIQQDSGAPPEEIERLLLLAESLFQVVSDYHLFRDPFAFSHRLDPLRAFSPHVLVLNIWKCVYSTFHMYGCTHDYPA